MQYIKWVPLGFLIFIFHFSLKGQSAVDLLFFVEVDTIGFFDRIEYEFTVKNHSNKTIEVNDPGHFSNPVIEYKELGDREVDWKTIGSTFVDRYMLGLKPGYPKSYIPPKSDYQIKQDFIAFSSKKKFNDYCFRKPGSYVLRAIYNIKNNKQVVSNEVKIVVDPYGIEDEKALSWIIYLSNPQFFYQKAIYKPLAIEIQNANYIVENFPESKFAKWSELFLLKSSIVDINLELNEGINNKISKELLIELYKKKIIALEEIQMKLEEFSKKIMDQPEFIERTNFYLNFLEKKLIQKYILELELLD